MTKKETIQIMSMLSAFYGAGKGNPEIMAEGWYIVLEPYEFKHAYNAVLEYAKNDTREYASFPTVGNIVKCIEDEKVKEQKPINDIIRAISYGWDYTQLSTEAMYIIDEEHYDSLLKMDAEEFSRKAGIIAESLKKEQKRLVSGNA